MVVVRVTTIVLTCADVRPLWILGKWNKLRCSNCKELVNVKQF